MTFDTHRIVHTHTGQIIMGDFSKCFLVQAFQEVGSSCDYWKDMIDGKLYPRDEWEGDR